ncbi:MAG: hypothetical protein ACTSVY_10805, partial [Candidatus Helarchaeota archaeon]
MYFRKVGLYKKIQCYLIISAFVLILFLSFFYGSINLLLDNQSKGINQSNYDISDQFFYHQSSLTTNLTSFSYNYTENITIFVYYHDLVLNSAVDDGSISCSIGNSFYSDLSFRGNGNYSIMINTSTTQLIQIGTNKITFQGTSPTAESKTLNINLEINITSTISGVLNGTFD